MSRTILAKAEGFTPVIDNVLKDTSLIAAVVFGGMWRYCQMKSGVCQATLDKIADRVGLSRGAVIEHIKTLENAGYIEDKTPGLRNRPHTYRDTGKAGLHIGVSGVHVVDSENDEDELTVHDVDSAVHLADPAVHVVDSHSTPRVLEDSIKKEVKKEIREDDSQNQKNFESAAFQVFGANVTGWRGMQRYLKDAQYFRDDGQFRVAGCGMPATMLQDRYALSFGHALSGVLNHPTEVIFEE